MVIASAVLGFVKGLISPATEIVKGWQARKSAKLEGDLAITAARTTSIVNRLETKQAGDIAWENLSIDKSGWKDEWFVILLSIPAVMCFVPGMVEYVDMGFRALSEAPEWYKWAFMVAIGSSFGYKKICDFMSIKKGS